MRSIAICWWAGDTDSQTDSPVDVGRRRAEDLAAHPHHLPLHGRVLLLIGGQNHGSQICREFVKATVGRCCLLASSSDYFLVSCSRGRAGVGGVYPRVALRDAGASRVVFRIWPTGGGAEQHPAFCICCLLKQHVCPVTVTPEWSHQRCCQVANVGLL